MVVVDMAEVATGERFQRSPRARGARTAIRGRPRPALESCGPG